MRRSKGDISRKNEPFPSVGFTSFADTEKCRIVKVRKDGTKNYYCFDVSDDVFENMISMLHLAEDISHSVPSGLKKITADAEKTEVFI